LILYRVISWSWPPFFRSRNWRWSIAPTYYACLFRCLSTMARYQNRQFLNWLAFCARVVVKQFPSGHADGPMQPGPYINFVNSVCLLYWI
jgi:hypothetical protein